ncbi:multiple epidermal growth factor-like domains protein 10 [Mya arenaria]|uniref:multiple epidermal growth factor-like domains protein 10 n=1 Tax=Mya arenaria TaxID=6604 RepID=UPI0022E20D17|nr:multiple epidermal growth factor-like domains protein 10 [Mya arenaria]
MDTKYWILAVGVVVAMSYASVEGGSVCTPTCNANQTCNSNNMCECLPAYKLMDSACMAKEYDDACTAAANCQSGHLGAWGTCTSGKCACSSGYTLYMKMCSKGYDDTCTNAAECKTGSLGAWGTCTSGKCACMAEYTWYMNMCSKGYDDACTADANCTSGNLGNRGVCKSSKCACHNDYSWAGGVCSKGAAGVTISITLMLAALLSRKLF